MTSEEKYLYLYFCIWGVTAIEALPEVTREMSKFPEYQKIANGSQMWSFFWNFWKFFFYIQLRVSVQSTGYN